MLDNKLSHNTDYVRIGKVVFAVLLILFLSVFVVLIKNSHGVKGEKNKPWPVVIWDGYKKINGQTTSDNVAEILAQNNIKIFPEDKTELDLITDPIIDGSAGQRILIKRAPEYFISVDGQILTVRSWDPTVDVLIKKGGVTLHKIDIVEPAPTAKLLPGDTVVVTRINEEDVEISETIDFKTVYRASTAVAFGQKQVIQEGIAGKVNKTYHVTYRNGVEVSRWLKDSDVITAKQDKIIATGVITGRANFGYYSGMVTSFYKGMTGHHLLVTNLANGKQVTVKIIGSGPFNGPLMDMGTEPFQAIGGTLSSGYIPSVSVQLLD